MYEWRWCIFGSHLGKLDASNLLFLLKRKNIPRKITKKKHIKVLNKEGTFLLWFK